MRIVKVHIKAAYFHLEGIDMRKYQHMVIGDSKQIISPRRAYLAHFAQQVSLQKGHLLITHAKFLTKPKEKLFRMVLTAVACSRDNIYFPWFLAKQGHMRNKQCDVPSPQFSNLMKRLNLFQDQAYLCNEKWLTTNVCST